MTLAVCEAGDLVLDGGAIARPRAADLAGIHRGAVQIGADDGVGRRYGAGNAAGNLRRGDFRRQKRKGRRRFVARLHLKCRPINRAAINSRRRAGLEAAHLQTETIKCFGKTDGGRIGLVGVSGMRRHAAGGKLHFADMHQPSQKCAGGEDDRRAGNFLARCNQNAGDDSGL